MDEYVFNQYHGKYPPHKLQTEITLSSSIVMSTNQYCMYSRNIAILIEHEK